MKKTFLVSCVDLDQESFLVSADTIEEAKAKALQELGWYVVQDDSGVFDEDEEEYI